MRVSEESSKKEDDGTGREKSDTLAKGTEKKHFACLNESDPRRINFTFCVLCKMTLAHNQKKHSCFRI